MFSHSGRTWAVSSALLIGSILTGVVPVVDVASATDQSCPNAVAPSGAGTELSPFQISTSGHLQWVKESSEAWDAKWFLLLNNINMAGCVWDGGIGSLTTPFTGNFDGNVKTIFGLTVDVDRASGAEYEAAGFFEVLGVDSIVRNLIVKADVSAKATGIGGTQPVVIAGGIVGKSNGATLTNVKFVGNVTASSTSNHPYAGGIVGEGSATLSRVTAIADVSAGDRGRASAGGIAGGLSNSTIEESWAAGSVFSSGNGESKAAGFVGTSNNLTILRSFSEVAVEADVQGEKSAGGFTGRTQGSITIRDSYARGSVIAPSNGYIGGLIGWLNTGADQTIIENSYFGGTIGIVDADGLGGLGGNSLASDITVTDVFWDSEVSESLVAFGRQESSSDSPTVNGAGGKTTAEMTDFDTYDGAGWDIADGYNAAATWGICASYNDGYPYLIELHSGSPCSVEPATMLPATQQFPTTLGDSVLTDEFDVSFDNPFFMVNPTLPRGLTLNSSTGVISGTIEAQKPDMYTVTALSTSLPYQRVEASVTQTAEIAFDRQISAFDVFNGDNGGFQAVATGPANGASLVITFGQFLVDGSAASSYFTYLIDRNGDVISGPNNIVPADFVTSSYYQPAVAYNPITGGWLACYATRTDVSQPVCQYLNSNGSALGEPFLINELAFTDDWAQTAIAYSSETESFFVVSTSYGDNGAYTGPIGRFVDANGAGVLGDVIEILAGTGLRQRGGLDLAYSTVSNTFGLITRGSLTGGSGLGPWFFHLDGSGTRLSDPSRFWAEAQEWPSNASIAYDRIDNQFMVVGFKGQNINSPLVARRFNAATGQPIGSPVETAISTVDFSSWGTRPAIAAHSQSNQFMVAFAMTSSETTERGIYTMTLDRTGVGSEPTLSSGTAGPTGSRPRIAFNSVTCRFIPTFSVNASSWGWQLFSSSVAGAGCTTASQNTPSVEPSPEQTPTRGPSSSPDPLQTAIAKVRNASPEQIRQLTPTQLAALPPQAFGAMSPAQVKALRPAQVAKLNRAQIQALPVASLRAMKSQTIARLTPTQLRFLTSQQANSLLPRQLRALNPETLRIVENKRT